MRRIGRNRLMKKTIEKFMDKNNCGGMYRDVWDMVNMPTQRERRRAFVEWLKMNLGDEIMYLGDEDR